MRDTVTIDPGLRNLGVAIFRNKILVRAFLWELDKSVSRASRVRELRRDLQSLFDLRPFVICETPRVYGGRSAHGDTQDLLDLSRVVGLIEQEFVTAFGDDCFRAVFPQEWAGQVPKEVRHLRLEEKMMVAEKAAIEKCPVSLRHNVLDAVGIGFALLNR